MESPVVDYILVRHHVSQEDHHEGLYQEDEDQEDAQGDRWSEEHDLLRKGRENKKAH